MSNHDNDPCAGCPAPHSSAPSAAPCPPGCPSDDAADTAAIAAHVAAGHTDHCAKRLVWGDGECECGKKGPARFDATGKVDPYGSLVQFADYEVVKASLDAMWFELRAAKKQRVELSRALVERFISCDATGRPWRCVNCGELSRGGALTHTPGCPVALAEKIVKEAGDGR